MSSAVANHLWWAWNRPRQRRLEAALADPGAAQERWLRDTLRRQRDTEFGCRHGFRDIATVRQFQDRVPLSSYDDYANDIVRIRAGTANVLTSDPVTRLIPSSGSTAARKLVPYTRTLQAEFNRAIGPWIVDLFHRQPVLACGPAYWSVSPVEAATATEPSAVPIGFDDDSRYLGGLMHRIVNAALAVPGCVRHISDVESFRYVTLLFLLKTRGLRLISVWHPSFLTLLLRRRNDFWAGLIRDIARGEPRTPEPLDPALQGRLKRLLRADPARARELDRLGPERLREAWPALGQVSCWCDGQAAAALPDLQLQLPGIAIQPKGLLATEAFVTLPYGGGWPVAVRSHFFEFLDDADHPRLVAEIQDGHEYRVVVTTGGGLYRYRLADRVRVAGHVGRTPSLRFIGKEDRVSDLCGEKLSDGFVAVVLEQALAPLRAEIAFAMLAPDEHPGGPPGYTLFVEARQLPQPALAEALDRVTQGLLGNPHYAYCLRLGQLAPLRLFLIDQGAQEAYAERCRRGGQRLGDIKPAALHVANGWRSVFRGRFMVAG